MQEALQDTRAECVKLQARTCAANYLRSLTTSSILFLTRQLNATRASLLDKTQQRNKLRSLLLRLDEEFLIVAYDVAALTARLRDHPDDAPAIHENVKSKNRVDFRSSGWCAGWAR